MKQACMQYSRDFINDTASEAINYSCSWTNIVLASPTTILNLSLIIVLATSRDRKKACNILLMNLAITDLIVGFVNMPLFFIAYRFIAQRKDPCLFVEILTPFLVAVICESFLVVTLIAIERYVSIFHPFLHSSMLSSRNVTICIVTTWTISISLVIPLFLRANSSILFASMGGTVIIGILVNLYCYLRILLQARKVRLQIQSEAARLGGRNINAADKRYIYLGILIVVSMVLCFSLEVTGSILWFLGYRRGTLNKLRCWEWSLVAFNSFINPFITCSFCPDIRKKVLKILTCRVCCQKTN